MATKDYRIWNAAGRPFRRPPWLSEIKVLARAYGVPFLGDLGNEAHLQDDRPEDHTPYSYTEWPVQISGYVINAIDLGKGAHGDRILADARAGLLPWLKYMNHRGRNYSRRRDNFRTGTPSGDDHLHLSGMSTHTWTGLNGYNPFKPAPAPSPAPEPSAKGDDDMRLLIANMSGRATIWTGLRNSDWPLTAESDEETVNALALAGGVRVTFADAESLVGACGVLVDADGDPLSFAESVEAVKRAG